MALVGVASGVSIILLIRELVSTEPITRLAMFFISAFTVLSVVNAIILSSIYSLRKLAELKKAIADAQKETLAKAKEEAVAQAFSAAIIFGS